jgi:biopolymer transport protein TolR
VVGSQTLRVGTFSRHLLNRKAQKARLKRAIVAGLMLTSMVDMFSLLVIFLLQSFSNSPEAALAKGLNLPPAISGISIQDAPILSISNEQVTLDQKIMGTTNEVLAEPKLVLKKLDEMKMAWAKTHKDETFKGDIHIQADRELPSTVVSQFMNMAIVQGYGSIQLAVVAGK